jgi:integrase
MIVKLTARTVDSLKPTGTRVEYFDAEVPGLSLRVTPTGVKSWTVLYRHRQRLRRHTLGTTAVLSLAEAREQARDVLHDARKGADPATEKQEDRKAETIGDLARLYLEQHAKRKKRSWKADDRILRVEILPAWQHRAIKDIKRSDVLALVDAIADRGAPILANRTTALISTLFKFALNKALIEASPAVSIPRPSPEHQRDKVLSGDELRSLSQSFAALEPAMAAFYQLRLLTAQRGGEVSTMRWQDVDLKARWWTIPAGVSKNKLAHRVPLSAPALTILKALRREVDHAIEARKAAGKPAKDPVYVLEHARGKRQQSEAAATFTVPDFRGHDLRRTAASLMASGGIPRLTISKILNHVERSVTAVYDRHSYDAEKRAALDWWARKLQAIVENKASKVLPFQRTG